MRRSRSRAGLIKFSGNLLLTYLSPTKQSIWVSGIKKAGINDPYVKEDDQGKLLTCLSRLYKISINDFLYTALDYYFYQHGNFHEKGLRVMLDTRCLPRGKNMIHIIRKRLTKEKELIEKPFTTIPFWLEK